MVYEDPSQEPPRGDSHSQPSTPQGAVPPVGAPISTGGYLPEVMTQYPDDYVFPKTDAEIYGQHGPVRADSERVPVLTSAHWKVLSKSQILTEKTLYPF